MTKDNSSRSRDRSLRAVLPWMVAAAACGVYFLTLHRSVSLASLPVVSSLAGWDWQPPLSQPLLVAVTAPLRLLPERFLPLALNSLSALCAGLTLAMLVRSVMLLPRDRVPIYLHSYATTPTYMPMAWLPPLLAALGCGLQLTFWENATAGTGEMLTLLLFAFVIRCVLEYRHRGNDLWLYRAVFVAGLAAANDWAMLAFLPLLLVALIWVKGIEFFNQRFLARIGLLGLAGLLLYLLPVVVNALTPHSPITFWKALKHNLGSELGVIRFLAFSISNQNRDTALLLTLVSLMPLLAMSIRWHSFSGGTIMMGAWLVTLPFHIAHALFLGICVWVFLDPPFSPRVAGQTLGAFLPYLTLYYLAALGVGYFSGYFLQRFGKMEPANPDYDGPPRRSFGRIVCGLALVLLVALPALLLVKNLPLLRDTNSDALLRYGQVLTTSLPPAGAVLLSDDPLRMGFVQAALSQQGRRTDYLPLDTRLLSDPAYLRYLHERYPRIWTPAPPTTDTKPDLMTILLTLRDVSRTNTLCYLHPSFGYFFEAFHPEPYGLVSVLRLYPSNVLTAPLSAPPVIASSLKAWRSVETNVMVPLEARLDRLQNPPRDLRQQILNRLKVRPEQNLPLWLAGAWYSRAINAWGVTLQIQRQYAEAADAFNHAIELKPDNVAAFVNRYCCTNLMAGKPLEVDLASSPEAALGRYRGWEHAMNENGPFDAPEFCFALGSLFVGNNLYRQGYSEYDRVATLAPDFLPAMMMEADILATLGRNAEALEKTAAIRAKPAFQLLTPVGKAEFDLLQVAAWLGLADLPRALPVMDSVLAANTNNLALMDRAFSLCITKATPSNAPILFSNALAIVERELLLAPDNPSYLINQGYACLQLGQFSNAIPPLSQALTADPTQVKARFNRAIAYLSTGQWEAAQADYAKLEQLMPDESRVQYGLGEVAFHKHETNAAITHYTAYLSNAFPNTAESQFVESRLKDLRGGRK